MACRLAGTKPIVDLTFKSYILIEENSFENVMCKTAATLFRPV